MKRATARVRARWTAGLLATGLAVAGPAIAQTLTWTPSVSLLGTLTNNVDLEPTDVRESDFVTQITPAFTVNHTGARSNLNGYLSVPILLYARTGSSNNTVFPLINLQGDVELLDKLFYVEGAVTTSQQFLNPFGAQPANLTSATQNRYRSDTYRLSPYIKGVTQAGTDYELRNDNVWTNLSGAPINLNNSRYTSFIARASNTLSAIGWSFDYNYADTRFNNQDPITQQLVRFSPSYAFTPALRVFARGGYEDNQFTLTESRGAIYGVGLTWNPTPRTNVTADWEHRFFGSSYNFLFGHNTALTAWNVSVSRDISTYPQQLASIPAGASVQAFLNGLFAFRIPNAADRQQFVNQLILERNLPATLANPVNLYSQQIQLQESANATVGLIGLRNTVFLTIFYLKTEPIAGTGTPLPPGLARFNDNTQTGANLGWTHKLTPSLTLDGAIQGTRTTASGGLQDTTTQGTARVAVSTQLTALTSVFAGLRYQAFVSDLSPNYNETALFIGVSHTFR